jgi:sugar lactone lactonase YvrE
MSNQRIRKISPAGIVSTLAGNAGGLELGGGGYLDGPANFAQFYWPVGIALSSSGILYVADSYNGRIRKIQ